MITINPGTEAQSNTTEENAIKTAKLFAKELGIDGLKLRRLKVNDDDRGYYGFELAKNGKKTTLDIPGIETETVSKGIPFESPRVYVDGSSWLWCYGLDIAEDRLSSNK